MVRIGLEYTEKLVLPRTAHVHRSYNEATEAVLKTCSQ